MRERVRSQLEMRGQWAIALAALDQPRRAITIGSPDATAPRGYDTAAVLGGVTNNKEASAITRVCIHPPHDQ